MGTESDAERVARELLDALAKHDAAAFRPLFTDDVVYHNIPMEPAVGIEASIAFLDGFFGMFENAEVEILNLAVRDNVVLTERIDSMAIGGTVAALPVMGAIEVRDGKVCAWRDYFDMGQITAMLSGASG